MVNQLKDKMAVKNSTNDKRNKKHTNALAKDESGEHSDFWYRHINKVTNLKKRRGQISESENENETGDDDDDLSDSTLKRKPLVDSSKKGTKCKPDTKKDKHLDEKKKRKNFNHDTLVERDHDFIVEWQ